MNLKILEKKENPLLSRTEVTGLVTFERKSTPSNDEVSNQLASSLSKQKEQIVEILDSHLK